MSNIQEIEEAIIKLPTEERYKLRTWFDEMEAGAVQTTPNRGKKIIELLTAKGSVKMSTDEIMALTRGE